MSKLTFFRKFKWILILGFVLIVLPSFNSCSNGPNGPVLIDEEQPDDKGEGDVTPDNPGINYSLKFNIQEIIAEYC